MTELRFNELVHLKLYNEATAEELRELEDFIKSNPEKAIELQILTELLQPKNKLKETDNETISRHLQRLSNYLSEPVLKFEKTKIKETRWLRIVHLSYKKITSIAVAASLLAIGIFLYFNHSFVLDRKLTHLNEVNTKLGSRIYLTLPDGSQVWLNSSSHLSYSNDFTGAEREVYLEGEAFFDVKADKTRPFIIHTPKTTVRVLGTAFNVKCYPEDKTNEITVIRGSVEVTLNETKEKKRLKPNDKLIVFNEGYYIQSSTQDTIQKLILTNPTAYDHQGNLVETSWVKNVLAFRNEKFEDLAKKLERWYNVEIIFNDDSIKEEVFFGSFKNENIYEVMQALSITGKFHYLIVNNKIFITK